MTDNNSGNTIFDIWLSNQQQFLKAQQDWMQPAASTQNNFMNADFLDSSVKSWQLCEDQYNHWMKAAENWVSGNSEEESQEKEEDYSAQALNYMLNPATFMKSGFEMMDQVFRKLVNGPEFADIGMLEKKMMKSGQDWQNFKDAGQHYQEVISAAWLRAYNHFSEEFMDNLQQEDNPGSEEMLKRWLKIADGELVNTLRSDEFLEAQREFFAAGSNYRLKYLEFVDMWCESHGIPTRSEVDDLHRIIYQLRRDVRALQKEIKGKGKSQETRSKAKKAPAKTVKKKAVKKAVKKAAKKTVKKAVNKAPKNASKKTPRKKS